MDFVKKKRNNKNKKKAAVVVVDPVEKEIGCDPYPENTVVGELGGKPVVGVNFENGLLLGAEGFGMCFVPDRVLIDGRVSRV